ncbi:MAG: peptidase [Tetrasphaera sp.]
MSTTTRRRVLIAVTLASSTIGLSVAPAGASTETEPPASTGSTSTLAPVLLPGMRAARTYTAAEARAFDKTGGDPKVLAYWTRARMRAAKSLDLPGDRAVIDKTVDKLARSRQAPQTTAPVAGRIAAAQAKTPPVTNFSRTNGKLFIGGYNSTSWCSASAVNTTSERVVITAGHCVHSGKGGNWLNNLVFVPGYNGYASDPAPVGMFQAYRLRTFNAWINNGGQYLTTATLPGFQRDVGFVTTYSGGDYGTTVVRTVGGHGLAYNGGYSWDVSLFGYPGNKNSGKVMWACWGTTAADTWAYRTRIDGCGFGGGSSGGPWLWQYSNSTGLGYVRTVMSTYNSSLNRNAGAYFDTAVYNALQAANGDW